jgi:hypothetical protein
MLPASVALLGSRALGARYVALVRSVVSALPALGVARVASCCGQGACAFARAAVPLVAPGLSLAVFSASAFGVGVGALHARSRACVASSGAVVVFLASPSSVGSVNEMRLAASLGRGVFAFACGFSASALPALGAGAWVRASGALGALGAWAWSPVQTQNNLF